MKISLGLPRPFFRLVDQVRALDFQLGIDWSDEQFLNDGIWTGNLKNVICLSTHQSQITFEAHFYLLSSDYFWYS